MHLDAPHGFSIVLIKLPPEDNPYRLIIRKRRIHTFGWCGHSTTVREGSLTSCKTFTSLAKPLINLQQYEYKIHAHAISSDLVISCLKVAFILKNPVEVHICCSVRDCMSWVIVLWFICKKNIVLYYHVDLDIVLWANF